MTAAPKNPFSRPSAAPLNPEAAGLLERITEAGGGEDEPAPPPPPAKRRAARKGPASSAETPMVPKLSRVSVYVTPAQLWGLRKAAVEREMSIQDYLLALIEGAGV